MPVPQLEQPLEAQHFALNWQQQLAEAFTSITDLCEYLELNPSDLPVSTEASKQFPLRVPLSFAASMEKGNPNDPLLRQVLPISDELVAYPGFNANPVGDIEAAVQPGLLHKYHGRVLLINTAVAPSIAAIASAGTSLTRICNSASSKKRASSITSKLTRRLPKPSSAAATPYC